MASKKKYLQFHSSDRSCKVCKQLDKSVFHPENAPHLPIHVNCQCSYEEVSHFCDTNQKVITSMPSPKNKETEHIEEPNIPQSLSYVNDISTARKIMEESDLINSVSDDAIALLKKYETPYSRSLIKDANGNIIGIKPYNVGDGGITVGFGHFISSSDILKNSRWYDYANRNISIDEANALLKEDLSKFENHVRSIMDKNDVYLTQNEFDALVIQAYNYGNVNYLTDILKSGTRDRQKWLDVITERMEPNKKTAFYDGLMNRRIQELDLFLYGDYNGGPDVKKYKAE